MLRGVLVLVSLMSLGCASCVGVGIPGCENCPERCLQENNQGRCVTCLTDTHCRTDNNSTEKCTTDNRCICGSSKDCPEGQLCAGANGCVECKSNSDCKNEDKAICVANRCSKCEPKATRACTPEGVDACVKGTQTCINGESWGSCEDWKKCGAGEKCEKETCVPDCSSPAPCKDSETVCISQKDEVPGRYQSCTKDKRGCPVLEKEQKCKDTEVCDKGSCTPNTCPAAACKAGEQRCDGTTHIQKCGKNKLGCVVWLPKEPCSSKQVCSNTAGQCVMCEPKKAESCYSGDTKTKGVGECKAGMRTCSGDGSGFGPCQGEVTPVKEVCGDNKDNNCDGVVDELCPCKYKGLDKGVCLKARSDSQGKCLKPSAYETTEFCGDKKDNNCDGVVDEGCPCKYKGLDRGVCPAAQLDSQGKCQEPAGYKATEICGDSLDNNCNGPVDEGCPCEYNATAVGVCKTAKINARGKCQKPPGYSVVEKCGDGIDNNCDGNMDEGCPCDYLGNNKGVCATGKLDTQGQCQAPSTYSVTEKCGDSLDNNCDGVVDEGCPCNYQNKSKGVCANQTLSSTGQCPQPSTYSATEKCGDNLDNNCNGAVDEGCPCDYLGNNKGVCATGKLDTQGKCLAPSTYKTTEQCYDNEDNDCNGVVDEGCGIVLVVNSSINTSNGHIDGKLSTAWDSSTGVFKCGRFTIPLRSKVTVSGTRPLLIEVTDAVKIEGTLNASGKRGQEGGARSTTLSAGGAGGLGCCGGFNGGSGGQAGPVFPGSRGSGPGAGYGGRASLSMLGYDSGGGGGAGHATSGRDGHGNFGLRGGTYGSKQLTTTQGGSGGGGSSGGKAGRYNHGGSGGGGGGGYVKITSGVSITIGLGGTINANGGKGGRCQIPGAVNGGGAGSGGAIYLSAPTITNQGKVTALGGVNCSSSTTGSFNGSGSDGRIRVDTKNGVKPGGTFTPAIGFVGTR